MRLRFVFGAFAVLLAGCNAPSCDYHWGCLNDFECADDEICTQGFIGDVCESARLCDDTNPCPSGKTCVQRDGMPAGNPFESDQPGKKVCGCPDPYDSYCSEGGYGGGGAGGAGGSGASGGSGGQGGSGGGPDVCVMPFLEGNPASVRQLGGPDEEGGPLLAGMDSGQLLLAVPFQGANGAGDTDVAFLMLDASNQLSWSKTIGNAGPDTLTAMTRFWDRIAVATTFTGTLNLGPSTLDSGAGSAAAVFALEPVDGAIPWATALVSDGTVTVSSVAPSLFPGRVIVSGTFSGTMTVGSATLVSTGGTDGFVVAVDFDTGEAAWTYQLGGAGDQEITASAADPGDGSTFVGGDFVGQTLFGSDPLTADGRDAFVLRLDQDGMLSEYRKIGGPDRQVVSAMVFDGVSQRVAVAGARTSESQSAGSIDFGEGITLDGAGLVDAYVAAFPADLTVDWTVLLPGPADTGDVLPRAIAADCAGGITIAGVASDGVSLGGGPLTGHGQHDAFACKIVGGQPVWGRLFGGPGDDQAVSVLPVGNEGIQIGGSFAGEADFGVTQLTSSGGDDAFLLEVTP